MANRKQQRRQMLRKALGRRIQLFRQVRGITQGHLGLEVGVSQGQVSKWEMGDKEPTYLEMLDVVRVLQRQMDDFSDLLGSTPQIEVVHRHYSEPPSMGEHTQGQA